MLVIGHRGVSARAPENTLPAFLLALEHADGIETDVRLTADGSAVLMHDDDTSRTTRHDGCVSEMNLDDLRRLDPGSGATWGEPLTVPTLDELLGVALGRTRLYLELKGARCDAGWRSAAPVADAIADRVATAEDLTVSSFDPTAIARMRELAPAIPTALTIAPGAASADAFAFAAAEGHRECHISVRDASPTAIAAAHAAGLSVLAWTVNDAETARTLMDAGCDGVFSDDPLLLGLRGGSGDHG